MLLALCAAAAPAVANQFVGPKGMVVSANPIATQNGLAVLKAGGNAVDAAVEVALTLGVTMGYHSGIGGGCFMLVHTADGKTVALDGREMAPAAARPDMFIRDGRGDPKLSQNGPLATGIPGSLAVYDYATKTMGKKSLAELLEPAAKVAADGFVVPPGYSGAVDDVKDTLVKFPGSAALLLTPDGKPIAAGTVLRQPDLAYTYRQIAAKGTDYFYKSGFPQQVEAWMKANGGIVAAADFAAYQMRQREPLTTNYRGYTIVGFPPPSSGGTHVAEILNVLAPFDIAGLQAKDPALRVHVIAEAMKLAFADRAFFLGDPDFVKVPRGLTDAAYGADLAKTISLDHANDKVEHGTPPNATTDLFGDTFGKHTTHIAVADEAGNWVAITATVNTYFGSKVIVPGTGVILNDQMDDFSIQPGVANAFGLIGTEANAPGPGKRPLSSMSPTIVLKDNKPFMTVGAAGGPTIITQVLLTISNVIDLGDDLDVAMARPRFHHQWYPEKMRIDKTFSPAILDKLAALGHKLDIAAPAGACNGILRLADGDFVGVSEPRGQGEAAGFPQPKKKKD